MVSAPMNRIESHCRFKPESLAKYGVDLLFQVCYYLEDMLEP